MGQEELLKIMMESPNKFFSRDDFVGLTGLNNTSVTRCMRRLAVEPFVVEEHIDVLGKNSAKTYTVRIIKYVGGVE